MKTKWFSNTMACQTVRHRLYIDGSGTPYFVDRATVKAHFTNGEPVGLFGAGMSDPNWLTGRRIAQCLGSFKSVTAAKARAEELAGAL